MSKPEDIPQDIIDTAQALFDAERGEMGTIDVARAILAERERCAGVADARLCPDTAAAIRKGAS